MYRLLIFLFIVTGCCNLPLVDCVNNIGYECETTGNAHCREMVKNCLIETFVQISDVDMHEEGKDITTRYLLLVNIVQDANLNFQIDTTNTSFELVFNESKSIGTANWQEVNDVKKEGKYTTVVPVLFDIQSRLKQGLNRKHKLKVLLGVVSEDAMETIPINLTFNYVK